MKKVAVLPYDTSWPQLFEQAAVEIKAALSEGFVSIHHVGSTAVPGLAAKPKLDIIAEVKDMGFDHHDLVALGYEYRGGFNIPLRKSFTYRVAASDSFLKRGMDVNLHVFEVDDPEVELNLLFRDHLRNNIADREEYARLKHQLLENEASHRTDGLMYGSYTLGKHDLIQDILKKSGFARLRFVICTHHSEWVAAKDFRNKYFLQLNSMADPYTYTFNHNDHKHFILYKGIEIIGYAHVQLWPEDRATVRIIVIDEARQSSGYGREFMVLIEKWLKLQGYKNVCVEG